MARTKSVRGKDFHDQLGCSCRNGRQQRNAQDRLGLIRHLHRGGGYLNSTPIRERSGGLSMQSDGHRLSREAGACLSGLNSERNRGHVVLLRTGEGCHVECAPVAVVVVQKAATWAGVARAGVACRDRLTGGVRNRRGTRWCPARGRRRRRGGQGARGDECESGDSGECRPARGSARRVVCLEGTFGCVGEAHVFFGVRARRDREITTRGLH
jgi:hypothetical protein